MMTFRLQVWECEFDHDLFKESKDIDSHDIRRNENGQIIKWCSGKCQHARARLSLE
jgi:hypothetical protein